MVYINSDTAVSGPIMFAEASPTISKNVIEAAKRVPYINDNYASYFDFWKEWLETGMIFLRNHWNEFQKTRKTLNQSKAQAVWHLIVS